MKFPKFKPKIYFVFFNVYKKFLRKRFVETTIYGRIFRFPQKIGKNSRYKLVLYIKKFLLLKSRFLFHFFIAVINFISYYEEIRFHILMDNNIIQNKFSILT